MQAGLAVSNRQTFFCRKVCEDMNEDTVTILQEINSGCKTATNSIDQVIPSIVDDGLKELIEFYKEKHVRIAESAAVLLNKAEKSEKDPNWMARAMTWIGTEMRLMMGEENSQIAKVMMDGCNMGIQSVSEYVNKYPDASKESQEFAKEIIRIEEDFMQEMKGFV